MSLHFELKVNQTTIGLFVATRQTAFIPATRICTYDVTVEGLEYMDKPDLIGPEGLVVAHTYDDGPWTLIRKALGAHEGLRTGRLVP